MKYRPGKPVRQPDGNDGYPCSARPPEGRWGRARPDAVKGGGGGGKRFTLAWHRRDGMVSLYRSIAQVCQQTRRIYPYQAVIAIPVAVATPAPPFPTTNPSLGGY